MTLKISPKPPLSAKLLEYGAFFTGCIVLFWLLLGYALNAGFSLIDDHLIYHLGTLKGSPFQIIWDGIISNIIDIGRFRPGYIIFYYAEVLLFGPNPFVWHLFFLGYGVITCFLFYETARKIGADIISAAFLVLLVVATGSQNSIWYRLGTGETWGMLLTGLAVFSMAQAATQAKANRWDVLMLFFMLIMGSPKESFVLLIPALLMMRVGLHRWKHQSSWRQTAAALKTPLLTGSAIFIVEMIAIGLVLLFRAEQYGAQSADLSWASFSPVAWYALIITIPELAYLTGLGLIILIILTGLSFKDQKLPAGLAFGGLMTAVWLGPQLILYKRSMGAHYLFPALVGLAAFCAFGLTILWKKRLWWLWGLSIILFMMPILAGVTVTTKKVSAYTADTIALREMVTYLAETTPADKAIMIVADPLLYFERVTALRTHLRFAGVESPVYLLPVFPQNGYPDNALVSSLLNEHFKGYTDPDKLTYHQMGAIIGLSAPTTNTKIPGWYSPDQWTEIEFKSPIYTFSFQKPGYFETGHFSYTVLVPKN